MRLHSINNLAVSSHIQITVLSSKEDEGICKFDWNQIPYNKLDIFIPIQ